MSPLELTMYFMAPIVKCLGILGCMSGGSHNIKPFSLFSTSHGFPPPFFHLFPNPLLAYQPQRMPSF